MALPAPKAYFTISSVRNHDSLRYKQPEQGQLLKINHEQVQPTQLKLLTWITARRRGPAPAAAREPSWFPAGHRRRLVVGGACLVSALMHGQAAAIFYGTVVAKQRGWNFGQILLRDSDHWHGLGNTHHGHLLLGFSYQRINQIHTILWDNT